MQFPAICRPKFQTFPFSVHRATELKQTVKKLNPWGETVVDKSARIKPHKEYLKPHQALSVHRKWQIPYQPSHYLGRSKEMTREILFLKLFLCLKWNFQTVG